MNIKQLPADERPYEKAETIGVSALSDAELLAIIIRTGSKEERSVELARKVLSISRKYEGVLALYHLDKRELMRVKGIGRVKALQLLCIAEISKRMSRSCEKQAVSLDRPGAIAEYYMADMRNLEAEELRIAFLDIKNRMICSETLFIGSASKAFVEPREIFIRALKNDACSIVMVHNHPSGDPSPSEADISVTKRIREAAKLLGISLLDHIIIGDNRYVSFKESGIIHL